MYTRASRAMLLLLAASLAGLAQTTTPATTPGTTPADPQAPATTPAATTPAAAPTWSVGPIDFSGLVDGYYSFNFNHPASRNNAIRNFDVKANQFSLNMAKLSMEHTPDPIGFRVDFGFGRAFEIFHAAEPGGLDVYRNIEQAFISFKPPKAKGLQVDFGKFVTSAGAELTETYLNWNYSRSLIFANGPYYHFGLRTSIPVGKHFTGGVQVLNGWNNVEDNNSGKTIGLTGSLAFSKATLSQVYLVGPEKTNTNEGKRQFSDTVLTITPSAKTSAYLNFDYGTEKLIGGGRARFLGVAGAFRYAINDSFAVSPRLEWYNDADGFITGVRQRIKEVTITGEYKMKEGFLTRLEYRRDWSNQPYFDRGNELQNARNQDTLLIGFVAFFGPKR